jgi:cullin 3
MASLTQGLGNVDADLETTWVKLAEAFKQIHTKNASILSYEELYRFAYRVVLKKNGAQLYSRVIDFERDWLTEHVRTDIQRNLSPSLLVAPAMNTTPATELRDLGLRFMEKLKAAWAEHTLCMGMIADTLMYLDRVYCLDNHIQPILPATLQLFRDNVLLSPTSSQDEGAQSILAVLINIMLSQIQMERDGDVMDKSGIKACTQMLCNLYSGLQETDETQLYTIHFEPAFLDQTSKFFGREAERLLGSLDCESYCAEVWRRIDSEEARCQTTISNQTMEKVKQIVVAELAQNKIQTLIDMESGLVFMIENNKIEGLDRLYRLNALVDRDKNDLKKALSQRVIQEGEEINKVVAAQQAQPAEKGQASMQNQMTAAALKWVADILDLKDKYDNIWKQAFDEDQILHAALTRSFSDFINSSTFQRGSEYLSLFIDENMKKGIRDKTEAQVDEVLDKAIEVLKYVSDKDMFERYYKKHLSKRLLMNKSVSLEIEKQMISRMKIELGNSFTMKLEAMFKDMATSKDLTQGYKDYVSALGDKDPSRVDLKIDVLTSGTWPIEGMNTNTDDEVALRANVAYPPAVQRVIQGFERYYAEKHSGRKLSWQPNLGTADMTIRFANKAGAAKPYRQHEVNVPTSGMIVLMLFQNLDPSSSISYAEIKATTGIWDHELKRILQSLAVAKKTQILRKEPMSREIGDEDKFFFNESFKSEYRRVKVGMVAAANRAETETERAKTEKQMDDQRNYVVDAAIVRIMKCVLLHLILTRHNEIVLTNLAGLKRISRTRISLSKPSANSPLTSNRKSRC